MWVRWCVHTKEESTTTVRIMTVTNTQRGSIFQELRPTAEIKRDRLSRRAAKLYLRLPEVLHERLVGAAGNQGGTDLRRSLCSERSGTPTAAPRVQGSSTSSGGADWPLEPPDPIHLIDVVDNSSLLRAGCRSTVRNVWTHWQATTASRVGRLLLLGIGL